jgi:hypothetical protein
MTAKTDYLESALVNHVLRNTEYVRPASVWVALLTSSPGETGTMTSELSGDAYARQQVTFGAPTQVDGRAEVANSDEILFPQATGNWSEATHFAIMDASSSGNALYYAALTTPRTASTGDQIRFPVGSLKVAEG